MSQFEIGGFKIDGKAIYKALFDSNKTSTKQLKALDKNNDGKISEDELQEVQLLDSSKDDKKVSKKTDSNGNVTEKTVVSGSGKNKTTTTTYYDSDGNKTKKVIKRGQGENAITKTVTYENGVRKKAETIIGKGDNQIKKTVEYDKNGNKVSGQTIKGQGDKKVTIDKTYKNGKKISSVSTGNVDGSNSVMEREFDSNGNIIKQTVNNKNGTSSIERSYDDNGNLASKKEISSDGSTMERIYSNYEKDGEDMTRSVKITVTEKDGTIKEFTEKQILNSNGRITKTERFDSNNKKVRETSMEYNSDGKLKSKNVKSYNPEKNITKETNYSNFEYNSNGRTYDKTVTITDENGSRETTNATGAKYFDGTVVDSDMVKKEEKS